MVYSLTERIKGRRMNLKTVTGVFLLSFFSISAWAQTGSQSKANSELLLKQYGSDQSEQIAFINTLGNALPLSPSQIKILHKRLNNVKRAADAYPGTLPRPTSRTVEVNVKLGATPPVLRLQAGFVTSLVFTDQSGQPWPIQAYDNGNPSAFSIASDFKANSSALMIQGKGKYSAANLVVMLKHFNTPISITLLTGQPVVDYRVDMMIPRPGPNAAIGYVEAPQQASPQLLDVLDGVPLPGAKRLTVSGGGVEVWRVGDFMYVRTSMSLISPGWISTMSSSDGTHAYKMRVASVLLASKGGSIVPISVKGL